LVFSRKNGFRALIALVCAASLGALEPSCVPKGACLRNTDCATGQSCVEGACVFDKPSFSDAAIAPLPDASVPASPNVDGATDGASALTGD
jgi:hypothetical protein